MNPIFIDSASFIAQNQAIRGDQRAKEDVYFSADVETDGPIPGVFSMLSFAIVLAGRYDGVHFLRPSKFDCIFYRELKPISDVFEPRALEVNGLDRDRLTRTGDSPEAAMSEASDWIRDIAGGAQPVLVAYPLSFDWTWLYWYFVRFSQSGSPFSHSSCFDVKTAFAVKSHRPISQAGRSAVSQTLRSSHAHTHHAVDDAIEQAEIFTNVFLWSGQ